MQLAITPDLARLADDLDLAVYVMQPDEQRCLFASHALEQLLPASPDGIALFSADPVVNAAHPDDRPALEEALATLPCTMTLRVGADGGASRTVTGRWASADAEGRRVVVGVVSAEPERGVLAGDQLDQVSHDLRTPLNAVLGYAQLLGLTDLQPDQRNSVEQVIAGGRRLLGVIERLETGGQ